MLKGFISLIVGLLTLPTVGLNSTIAAENTIDYGQQGRFDLGICQTSIQLDCIEPKITITHKDGTSSEAEHDWSRSNKPFLSVKEKEAGLYHTFRIRSGTSTGNSKNITINTTLITPNSTLFGLLEVKVSASKKLTANECDDRYKKLCTRFTLDPEDKFTIVIRSQKLVAYELSAHAFDGDVVREDYLSGERWVFTGSQTLIGWNPGMWWSVWAVGSEMKSVDPNKYPKPIELAIRCAERGVMFASSNSLAGGAPGWDAKTNSLNFGLSSPHLDANGDLNKGFFKARIPKKWLDCRYPENNLSMADEVVVSITYDDGTSQVATSITKVTENIIYIDVPVLHFSSPTIRIINATFAKSTPAPKTRKCLKGKVTKKVAASKCPSGWKSVA